MGSVVLPRCRSGRAAPFAGAAACSTPAQPVRQFASATAAGKQAYHLLSRVKCCVAVSSHAQQHAVFITISKLPMMCGMANIGDMQAWRRIAQHSDETDESDTSWLRL